MSQMQFTETRKAPTPPSFTRTISKNTISLPTSNPSGQTYGGLNTVVKQGWASVKEDGIKSWIWYALPSPTAKRHLLWRYQARGCIWVDLSLIEQDKKVPHPEGRVLESHEERYQCQHLYPDTPTRGIKRTKTRSEGLLLRDCSRYGKQQLKQELLRLYEERFGIICLDGEYWLYVSCDPDGLTSFRMKFTTDAR